jgi:cytochrome c biogenesis protein CcdA
MTGVLFSLAFAFWLGLLASMSPCALATNVAAISFLSKKISHPALVFISGFAYTLGRMSAYSLLGWIIIGSLLTVPQAAQFLQKYMGRALGPVLIIAGLVLLEMVTLRLPGLSLPEKKHNRFVEAGALGAFVLGFIFALAFCPVSAALFFGSLIPLALNSKSGVFPAFMYGIGTGLPVLVFAVAIALGVVSLSRWFHMITRLEYYTRKITGVIFIVTGLYYAGTYILDLF